MSDCQHHETLLSTWLDGPLDRNEQIESLDHLVRCPDCRRFWIDGRALDGLIAAVRTSGPVGETPPPEVWTRIAQSIERRPVRRRALTWGLQAAAVLVVSLGVALALWNGSDTPTLSDSDDDVLLGQGIDMTDDRFIELTRELLSAEPKYRATMLRVLEEIERSTAGTMEAASEEENSPPEEQEADELREVDVNRIPA